MILIAAFVAQQHSRSMILRDKQISCPVVIVVSRQQTARRFQMNFVETHSGSYVLESLGTLVAKQSHFTAPVRRFAYSSQIHPAVVVVIQRGHAPGTNPIQFRKRNRLKRLPILVTPQRKRRRPPMREGQIHPSIFVEVENCYAYRRRGHRCRPRLARRKLPFLGILINRRRSHVPGRTHKIDCAVIVGVRAYCGKAWPVPLQRQFGGHVGESTVTIVSEHDVRACNFRIPRAHRRLTRIENRIRAITRDVEVDIAVMVVIHKGHANVHQTRTHPEIRTPESSRLTHIFKLSIFLVMQQQHAISQRDRQIDATVVVVVPCRTPNAVEFRN